MYKKIYPANPMNIKKKSDANKDDELCQCYDNGKQPALLTDWRKTNICQSCLKPKKFADDESQG